MERNTFASLTRDWWVRERPIMLGEVEKQGWTEPLMSIPTAIDD